MSESLISQELIETIFVSLQEEDKNIRKIIKGLFNFLKENNYSNNEIRIALQEFFSIRRDYIVSEYNLTYNQVGYIVENLIMGIDLSINTQSSNVNVSSESSSLNANVTVSSESTQGTQTYVNDETEDEDSEDEHFPRTRYVRFSTSTTYDPYFGDPFIGLNTMPTRNRFASFFNQSNYYVNSNGLFSTLNTGNQPSTINISAGLNEGISQQQNTDLPSTIPSTVNLNTMTTHQLLGSLSNILIAAANNPNFANMDDEDEEPFVGTTNGPTNNIALNLFNIILNSPAIRAPHMEDVKNVINDEELAKLEVKNWTSLDKEKYKTCPICLDDYSDESKVRLLKCEHGFHPECIDKWLTDCNYKCPVCRDDSNKHHAEI
jgi:hypothetical protein